MIQNVGSGLRINCPAARREAIAINSNKWQNKNREANHDKKRVTKGAAELGQVAKKPRGYKRAEKGISGEDYGLGGGVHVKFEKEPVSMTRLKELLETEKTAHTR